MEEKLAKVKAEVVRMHNLLPVVDGDNIYVNYADRICTTLEMYIDSLQEEPVSDDLEEAARKFIEPYREVSECGTDYNIHPARVFKAGAIWQKEQMIEEKASMSCALEWYDGFVLNFTELQLNDVVAKNNINIGDKVKVIVIKED